MTRSTEPTMPNRAGSRVPGELATAVFELVWDVVLTGPSQARSSGSPRAEKSPVSDQI